MPPTRTSHSFIRLNGKPYVAKPPERNLTHSCRGLIPPLCHPRPHAGDNDLGSATSRPFYVPTGATKLKFLRAGGADAPSGLYLKVFASDSGSYEPGATLCSPADNTPTGPYGGFYSNTGHNTDVMCTLLRVSSPCDTFAPVVQDGACTLC